MYSLNQLTSGCLVLAGQEALFGSTLLLSKTDSQGNVVFSKTVAPTGGLSVDDATCRNLLTIDNDSLLIPIYISSGVTGSFLAALSKFDTSTFNNGWYKRYMQGTLANSGNPRGGMTAVMRTATSHYVSAGWSNPGLTATPFDYGAHIQKMDLFGNMIWTYHFQSAFEFFYATCEAVSGDYVFAGGSSYARVLSTNTSGAVNWSYSYNIASSGSGSGITSIKTTGNTGYIIAGSHKRAGFSDKNGYLMKLDNAGNIVWAKSFGGVADDYLYNVKPTSDGGYVACGKTSSYGAGNHDGLIVKVNSAGALLWAVAYGTAADESLNDLIEAANSYYAAGMSGVNGWLLSANKFNGLTAFCEVPVTASITVTDVTATTVRTAMNYVMTSFNTTIPEPVSSGSYGISSTDLCPILLPVELVDFEGKNYLDRITLKWKTASEKDNARFEIQRSDDALSWQTLTTVNGNHTSNFPMTYQADDLHPINGTNYYRLIQHDLNKKQNIWGPISVEFKGESVIRVIPNPFQDMICIKNIPSVCSVLMYNNFNELVLKKELESQETDHLLTTSFLSAGIYHVCIIERNTLYHFKLIKN